MESGRTTDVANNVGSRDRNDGATTADDDDDDRVRFRVLCATDGACRTVELAPDEVAVSALKERLADAVAVEDQILLIGPPYKVPKDSTLRSEEVRAALELGDAEDVDGWCDFDTTERSGAKRLFLFSRSHASDDGPDDDDDDDDDESRRYPLPPPPPLPPLPPPSANVGDAPLHRALEVYERQFAERARRGAVLSETARDVAADAARSLRAQATATRAARAAVANAAYYRHNLARERAELESAAASRRRHRRLLDGFEDALERLRDAPLHPALVDAARTAGRRMETLLDTVPVERERAWAARCRTGHDRLEEVFREVAAAFAAEDDDDARRREADDDAASEDRIRRLKQETEILADQITRAQTDRLQRLRRDHAEALRIVQRVVLSDDNNGGRAVTDMEALERTSSVVPQEMEADDARLKSLHRDVAASALRVLRRSRRRLRDVVAAQSRIGRTSRRLDFLRAALRQQDEDVVHLDHVAELRSSYDAFAAEVRRRRRRAADEHRRLELFAERTEKERREEVARRERFLRGAGRHLMPAFFELFAPTLATPPPDTSFRTGTRGELDALPDLGNDDADADERKEDDNHGDNGENEGEEHGKEDDMVVKEKEKNKEKSEEEEKNTPTMNDDATITTLTARVAELEEELRVERQEREREQEQTRASPSDDRISHSSFNLHDVALFMPTGKSVDGQRTYLAFHSNCPHRYLSFDSVRGAPDYVLGRIVYQNQNVAEGPAGGEGNPFGLHPGTTFWVLTVEVVKVP